jgi:hypothetical protein
MMAIFKFICLSILMMSSCVFAIELSILRDSSDGLAIQTFTFDGTRILTLKKTNYFDKKNDYRLGTLTAVVSKKNGEIKTQLQRVKKKLSDSRSFLKTKAVPLPTTASQGHTSYFLLDGMVIEKGSIPFEDTEKVLNQLLSLKWNLQEGIEVSKDKKKVSEIRKGRVISSLELQNYFVCRSISTSKICRNHKKEILYVD